MWIGRRRQAGVASGAQKESEPLWRDALCLVSARSCRRLERPGLPTGVCSNGSRKWSKSYRSARDLDCARGCSQILPHGRRSLTAWRQQKPWRGSMLTGASAPGPAQPVVPRSSQRVWLRSCGLHLVRVSFRWISPRGMALCSSWNRGQHLLAAPRVALERFPVC
jgi:hypothetical protein